jgi:hypothetical protein
MAAPCIDEVIRIEYAGVPYTADEIVCDPKLAQYFLNRVNSRLPPHGQLTMAEFNRRLLNLRRRGEDKGGLVRKQRAYRGRHQKVS